MAYASLADLKQYAGIDNATNDVLLTDLLERATQMCRSYTRQEFAATVEIKAYMRDEPRVEIVGNTLTLWDESILDLTSVTFDDGTELEEGDFRLLPLRHDRHFKVMLLGGQSWRGDVFELKGYFGYSKEPPADIVHSIVRYAHHLYKQKDSAIDADRPTVSPEGLIMLPAGIPEDVTTVWKNYRRVL